MFAFASQSGVAALFSRDGIGQFLKRNKKFQLIVGVDAITNAEALLCIGDEITRFPSLSAEAFLHEHNQSTFHPKFAWFESHAGLTVVTGSGNLTARGIGKASIHTPAPGNWEAFGVHKLINPSARETLDLITKWVKSQQIDGRLLPLNNDRVRQRAMRNGLVRYPTPVVVVPGQADELLDVHGTPIDDPSFDEHDILIRELPRNRPGQADVGKDALEFLGYHDTPIDILIQYVKENNALGTVESQRLFVNSSQNYRFELSPLARLPYEIAHDDGRMIVVAAKLDRRSFRYTLVPVTSSNHVQLSTLLGSIKTKANRRLMREARMTSAQLRLKWPSAPLHLMPTPNSSAAP